MTNHPGDRQFTVPIPGTGTAAPEHTQVIPVDETTARELPYPPGTIPPMPGSLPPRPEATQPYAAGPGPGPTPGPAAAGSATPARAVAGVRRDSWASRFGAALFWMAIGVWVVVGARLARTALAQGWSDRLLVEAVDAAGDEALVAVGLSAVAALFLLAARGRRLLGVLAVLVAIGSAVAAAWRLLPLPLP